MNERYPEEEGGVDKRMVHSEVVGEEVEGFFFSNF